MLRLLVEVHRMVLDNSCILDSVHQWCVHDNEYNNDQYDDYKHDDEYDEYE